MAKKSEAGKDDAKKAASKKGSSKKGSTNLELTTAGVSEAVADGEMATSPIAGVRAGSADEALVTAEVNAGQCIVWRQGEFRKRVREAVADWAQEPPLSILPTNTLGELAKGTPWNTGQQARLVQTVKAHHVFAPPFPGTTMLAPSQLLPASTTVLQWERIVWRHQNPQTPCFPFTD
jgi:hypothetical protein